MVARRKPLINRRQLLSRAGASALLVPAGCVFMPAISRAADRPVVTHGLQSGDIHWLIEAVGDRRAVSAQLKLLSENQFKGRPVKTRAMGKDGKAVVTTIGPAGAGATPDQRGST